MAYGELLTPERTARVLKDERAKEDYRRLIAKEIAEMEDGSCLEFVSWKPDDLQWFLVLVIEKVLGGTKSYRVMMGFNSILVYKYKADEVGGKLW